MPNRVIREGFLDSEAIHNLSDAAECLFHRLLLAADDAGRFDGRLEVLRARLFPLDATRRTKDVDAQLGECVKGRLVLRYEWDRKPFLQVLRWQRSSNSQTSKYPWTDGTFAITFVQLQTRDGKKDFVASSIPSASHADGMQGVPAHLIGDGDGDEYGNGDGSVPPPAVKPQWSAGEGWKNVTPELKAEWKAAFPACDIDAQLLRMDQWLKSNPAKAKKSNWLKFITSWLTRSQDRGGDIGKGSATLFDQGTYRLTAEETEGAVWDPLKP